MECLGITRAVIACGVVFSVAGCFGKVAVDLEEASPITTTSSKDGGVDAGKDAAPAPMPLPPTDACERALAAATFTFEGGDQGWTHGKAKGGDLVGAYGDDIDPWTRGAAKVGTACHGGECFGTELSVNYRECQAGYLLSPPIDLSACSGSDVALVFHHAYSFWSGPYEGKAWFDGGFVEVSADGTNWQVPADAFAYTGSLALVEMADTGTCDYVAADLEKHGFVGSAPTTSKVRIPLPSAIVSSATRIRFTMGAGASVDDSTSEKSRTSSFGWRIDDVAFEVR